MAVAAVILPVSAQYVAEKPDRSLLEAKYLTWRKALITGDFDLWKKTTAKFRQFSVRNLAVSEKKPFPSSLFHLPMRPPLLTGLKFIGIKMKGPTVAATYYGKVDFGLADGKKPTDNAYVLLFVRENGEWQYDTARFFNLSQLAEVRQKLEKGDKTVLDEHDGFQPLGSIPPTPPLCPKPKYITKIFVDCPGRKVVAKVNNVSTHVFEDTRDAVIVSGGLQDGTNVLNYTVSEIPDAKKGHFTIALYIMPEIPGHFPGKAYYFHLNEDQRPINGGTTITVTKEILEGMKPKPGDIKSIKRPDAPAKTPKR